MKKRLISLIIMASITLTYVSPVFAKNFDGKQNVALTHAFTVSFNKTLAANQDFSKVTIKDANGNVVPVTVSIGSDDESITVTPKTNYSPSTNYTLTVDGIKDTAGDNLSDNATMQFTTSSTQPTEDTEILPQAVTMNGDGSVTPLTTNEYVDKACPGKTYNDTGEITNPNYDKNFGLKSNLDGEISGYYIDNDELTLVGVPYIGTTTFSDSFQYNKYMKDQMRELYKSAIGTTPYDGSHYLELCNSNNYDGIHDVVSFNFREITSTSNIVNFSYYFPVKPIVSEKNDSANYYLSNTWKHVKDNANLVLEIDDDTILDNKSVSSNNLKESLYACFGKNYVNNIMDFMLKQRERRLNGDQVFNNWDGNDEITIGNMSIYSSYCGRYYSFFLK